MIILIKNMKIKTKLTKLGRNSKKNKGFINPGIYKGSTILFENYKEYLKDLKNKEDTSHYGINNNPTCNDFENAVSPRLFGVVWPTGA